MVKAVVLAQAPHRAGGLFFPFELVIGNCGHSLIITRLKISSCANQQRRVNADWIS